jgi:hypothetical protein
MILLKWPNLKCEGKIVKMYVFSQKGGLLFSLCNNTDTDVVD